MDDSQLVDIEITANVGRSGYFFSLPNKYPG